MSEVVTHVAGRSHRPPRHGPRPLTPREREILHLVAQGTQQKAIARELHITPETVKEHLTNAYEALDALNAPHAVHLAHERGILGERPSWHLGEW